MQLPILGFGSTGSLYGDMICFNQGESWVLKPQILQQVESSRLHQVFSFILSLLRWAEQLRASYISMNGIGDAVDSRNRSHSLHFVALFQEHERLPSQKSDPHDKKAQD